MICPLERSSAVTSKGKLNKRIEVIENSEEKYKTFVSGRDILSHGYGPLENLIGACTFNQVSADNVGGNDIYAQFPGFFILNVYSLSIPPFRPIFQVAATRAGSKIRIINEPLEGSPVFLVETGESRTPPETMMLCFV